MPKRIISLITVISLIMCLLTSCAMINKVENALGISKIKYKKAMKLIDDGDLQAAYDILSEIKEYKPAKEELDKFHYVITTRSSVYASLDGKAVRSTITYQYDEGGRIAQMKSTGLYGIVTTTDYEYDEHGNVIRYTSTTVTEGREPTTDTGGYEYEYDTNGNMLSKTYLNDKGEPTGQKILYEYDEHNRLIKIIDTTPGYNTLTTAYTYDESGNLVKENKTSHYQGDTENIQESYEYTYDANGNVTVKKRSAPSEYVSEYTYDGANITKVYQDLGYGFWDEKCFSYDKNGNLISLLQTANGYSSDYTAKFSLSYDDNGCCVTIVNWSSNYHTTTYTAEYRLIYATAEVDEEMYSDILDVLPEY